MQRIVIMGPPGSGKSTLSRTLGARFGLPVHHLDQSYWQAGWIETPADQFRAEVARIAALPAWIIDGNYTDAIALRFQRADTIIYLDLPAWRSLLRIAGRTLLHYGRVRPDSAAGCRERVDLGFIGFVWSWNRLRRARTLALIETFAGRRIVLRRRSDWRRLLADSATPGATAAPPSADTPRHSAP